MVSKEHIQKLFVDTLTEDEKRIISVASVICVEGLDMETLFHLLMPDSPHVFYDIIDSLCKRNWLFQEHKRIYCDTYISNVVLEEAPANTDCLRCRRQEKRC